MVSRAKAILVNSLPPDASLEMLPLKNFKSSIKRLNVTMPRKKTMKSSKKSSTKCFSTRNSANDELLVPSADSNCQKLPRLVDSIHEEITEEQEVSRMGALTASSREPSKKGRRTGASTVAASPIGQGHGSFADPGVILVQDKQVDFNTHDSSKDEGSAQLILDASRSGDYGTLSQAGLRLYECGGASLDTTRRASDAPLASINIRDEN